MNCATARRWFDAYWDDEITQAERERLEAHFTECPACHAEYEELARALELTASLPRHEAAPDFFDQVVARARRAPREADQIATPRPVWVPVAAGAMAVVLLAAMLLPWQTLSRGPIAARTAPRQPELLAVGTPGALVTPGVATLVPHANPAVVTPALIDSLIDHGDDVDFVLDPVRVSRGRTAASRVVGPAGKGQALITF
jgi:anti-sigma factor RsiW